MLKNGHAAGGAPEMGSLPLLHGDQVPLHRHRQGHLVYPATGVLSIMTREGAWIAPANRLAWTPGGFEHHHRAWGYTDMRVVFLPAGLAAHLPDRPAVFAVSALVREAMLALTDGGAPRSPVARERLQALIIDELVPVREEPLHLPQPHDDRLRALSRLLHDDPANNATLTELGTRVGASKRTLTRLFRDELGMNFRQWRTQLRLHHALVLLATGRKVTYIAEACGWANPTSFIEAFSAALGETPARYGHATRIDQTISLPRPGRRAAAASPARTRDAPPLLYLGHDIDVIDKQAKAGAAVLLRWTASTETS